MQVAFTVLDRTAVMIPDDLMLALGNEDLADAFAALPPGKQNFIIRRIDEAARPETRNRRIQAAVDATHAKRATG